MQHLSQVSYFILHILTFLCIFKMHLKPEDGNSPNIKTAVYFVISVFLIDLVAAVLVGYWIFI